MNPSDFVKRYHNLTVRTPSGGERTVHAFRYFMKGAGARKKAEEIKAKLEADARRKDAVKALASKPEVCLDDSVIRRIFDGKGSPTDIAGLLEAAIFFNALSDDTAAIQAFCDENVGVDCSGFVDAFFRTGNRIGDDQSIIQKIRGHRKDATGIQPQDILCWYVKDEETKKVIRKSDAGQIGHVALVDSPPVSTGDGLGTMTVCEARAGGIGVSTNQYTIREVLQDEDHHTIYKVDCQLRGFERQKSDPGNFVRVYPCP